MERRLAKLASRAHGVVTRAQLLRAGISRSEIEERLKSGALLREYRGVYRVGHQAPSTEARYMAAVLACGQGALLAGRAAAYLLGILKGRPPAPEVATPGKRRVKGVRTRRTAPGHATVWRGIAVSNPARTLVDLAAYLPRRTLHVHATRPACGTTRRPAKWRPCLRAGPAPRSSGRAGESTLSRLERHFLYLLGENGLPPPQTNRSADGRRVDCRWPEHLLTVEVDSYRYPPLPPRVGAGPSPDAAGGRRIPPLHLRRRLRGSRAHAGRAPRAYAFGSMFWLTRKVLSGSYSALMRARRS